MATNFIAKVGQIIGKLFGLSEKDHYFSAVATFLAAFEEIGLLLIYHLVTLIAFNAHSVNERLKKFLFFAQIVRRLSAREGL